MLAKLTVALTATIASLTIATPAQAYVLGAADSTTQAAPVAAQMGARTYRLVMDPTVPLDTYAPRIEAYRALGMRPQLVIGGTGTSVRGKTDTQKWRIVNYAIHAQKRWPDSYSVSVVNEPNLSGVSACRYAKTFRTAYRMLKAAGAQRVLFGEWAPTSSPSPLDWSAAAAKCTRGVTADGWAWHCYDMNGWFGIQHAREIKGWLNTMRKARNPVRTKRGNSLPVYCTEYGVMTRGGQAYSEQAGAKAWANAFRLVKRWGVQQIVAWGVTEVSGSSAWDTSLIDSDGRHRAAFNLIASQR